MAGGIAYFTVVPQQTSLLAGETVPLTITAYDAGNNVVTLDNTTSVTLSSTGSAQFGAATGVLTNGVFATTVRDTVVQTFTITAEKSGGGPPSGTSAVVSVSNAGTYRVVKISGDGSGVTAGTTRPLEVEVRDLYGNPVPGALATFSVASAPDGTPSFTDTDGDPNDGIVVTNGSGRGLVTYHTALTAGTNQVNAQILDGSPLARERVTFAVNTVSSGATHLKITFLSASTAPAGQSVFVQGGGAGRQRQPRHGQHQPGDADAGGGQLAGLQPHRLRRRHDHVQPDRRLADGLRPRTDGWGLGYRGGSRGAHRRPSES